MEMDGVRTVVRRDDVIFIPPGVEHAIYNTGMVDLRFVDLPGQWQHVQTLASSHPTDTVVSHSQIYGDDAVCTLVAVWVEQRLIGKAE